VVFALSLARSPTAAHDTDASTTAAKNGVWRRRDGLGAEKFHFRKQLDLPSWVLPSFLPAQSSEGISADILMVSSQGQGPWEPQPHLTRPQCPFHGPFLSLPRVAAKTVDEILDLERNGHYCTQIPKFFLGKLPVCCLPVPVCSCLEPVSVAWNNRVNLKINPYTMHQS